LIPEPHPRPVFVAGFAPLGPAGRDRGTGSRLRIGQDARRTPER